MTKDEMKKCVKDLRKYDHAFLTTEYAQKISHAFGFKARTYVAHADPPGTLKGLSFKDPDVRSAEGIDASDLAIQICNHLDVEYPSMFGRGSQLRVCCDALEQWLNGDSFIP